MRYGHGLQRLVRESEWEAVKMIVRMERGERVGEEIHSCLKQANVLSG